MHDNTRQIQTKPDFPSTADAAPSSIAFTFAPLQMASRQTTRVADVSAFLQMRFLFALPSQSPTMFVLANWTKRRGSFFFFPSANKLENNTVPPFWNIACTGLFRPVLKRRKNSRWQKRITCTDSSFLGERVCFLKKKIFFSPFFPPSFSGRGWWGGGVFSFFSSPTQYALVVCVCVCDFVVFDGAGSGGDDGIGVGDDV